MFGERLREIRMQRGITQQKMADFLDVALRTYQTYETGTRSPSFLTVVNICIKLDISADYLLGCVDTPRTFSEFVDE